MDISATFADRANLHEDRNERKNNNSHQSAQTHREKEEYLLSLNCTAHALSFALHPSPKLFCVH